jgi:uncharacterized membrane protein YsdA (DUF1294 family)
MSAQPGSARRRAGLDAGTFGWLLVLLAMPAVALSRLEPRIGWSLLAGVPLAVSLFTWLAYWADKRRAETGKWRIPEATLHVGELLGGWPGAFLAQRQFRHKTAKVSYQIAFWLIVLLHQFLALDFLLGWKLTANLVHVFEP